MSDTTLSHNITSAISTLGEEARVRFRRVSDHTVSMVVFAMIAFFRRNASATDASGQPTRPKCLSSEEKAAVSDERQDVVLSEILAQELWAKWQADQRGVSAGSSTPNYSRSLRSKQIDEHANELIAEYVARSGQPLSLEVVTALRGQARQASRPEEAIRRSHELFIHGAADFLSDELSRNVYQWARPILIRKLQRM